MLHEDWMADHRERLLRMLPGGIHVVGVAWFSDKKTFTERKPHIHKTLGRIQKMNNQITTANVDESISDNMVIIRLVKIRVDLPRLELNFFLIWSRPFDIVLYYSELHIFF